MIKVIKESMFNHQGKTKLLPIIIVAAVVLLGAGGFYFFSQKTGVSIPGLKPAFNPNCVYNDPELCKYINNYVNMPKNFTITSTGNLGGTSSEFVYIINGENFQMIGKQGGKEISNMISIGDTTYTLDYTDNQWWKYTPAAEEGTSQLDDIKSEFEFDAEKLQDTTKYTFVGEETCGDLNCFKYEITMTEEPGSTKTFIFFDDRDYLTRKMRIEDADGTASESVYTYETTSVSEPSPVKEGTPYGGAAPPGAGAGAASGYSDEQIQQMIQQYQQEMPDTSSSIEEVPAE